MTGDIYYKEKDADGRLKSWSRANKFVAFLLPLPPAGLLAVQRLRRRFVAVAD